MELSSVGSSADFSRNSASEVKEAVTLISYNNTRPSRLNNNSQTGYKHRFVQNQNTNNYVVSSSAQSSNCTKKSSSSGDRFSFRPFRKRSKSASRLDGENLNKGLKGSYLGSQSNLLDLVDNEINSNRQQPTNHSDQVKLVGFSPCNTCEFVPKKNSSSGQDLDFAKNRFATLKTSREVKMERERQRQEKLHRLTQVIIAVKIVQQGLHRVQQHLAGTLMKKMTDFQTFCGNLYAF
jgi:hypothetical protein